MPPSPAFSPPYEPVDRLLLLAPADLAECSTPANLAALAAALGAGGGAAGPYRLSLSASVEFWDAAERGQILSAGHRTGAPMPLLDREVIRTLLTAPAAPARPRFAVIETDLTAAIGHNGPVSQMFLDGAEACGFQPVLGLNRAAAAAEGGIQTWAGFRPQGHTPGTADEFAEDLAHFVAAHQFGPDDVIFMHSLSPQIVLGAARFVAAIGTAAPRLVMRFFSTAEAMAGHRLSYTRILCSINQVACVRERMHFFCESVNLAAYYEAATGVRYPLLLNPEHPALAAVRRSTWRDPGLGGGAPALAFFGEARAEKGFDLLPGIVAELLADPNMTAFRFLIQTTVQNRFYAWRDSGLWDQIVAVLVMAVREAEGKQAAPSVVIVDSQSVKTTEAGGPRGYDAGKKIKGRKRHTGVDTLGLPIECQITPADVQDRDALPSVLKAIHQKSPWVKLVFVDGGYSGDETQRAAFEASGIKISVVKRSDRSVKGFVVLPKRWIVERTFGWLNRARRLAKDFEATIESSHAWVMLAIGFLLLRRVARDCQVAA